MSFLAPNLIEPGTLRVTGLVTGMAHRSARPTQSNPNAWPHGRGSILAATSGYPVFEQNVSHSLRLGTGISFQEYRHRLLGGHVFIENRVDSINDGGSYIQLSGCLVNGEGVRNAFSAHAQ